MKAITFAAEILCRILENSLDAIVVFLRKTIMREKRISVDTDRGPGLGRALAAEFAEAAKPMLSNFTFALMMTCIGIVVILFVVVYASFF